MTPLLASRLDMSTAVAAVSIPHAVATALRCWRLRKNIDRSTLLRFGWLSAAGGLAGALLYSRLESQTLTIVLAILLIGTGITALTRWYASWRPNRASAGILGLASGFFGGIAGNQGGLRAAALFPFGLKPTAFVATSTAIGLAVDAARMPVYLFLAGASLMSVWLPILVACLGVIAGTFAGEKILLALSPDQFRKIVGSLIGLLGVFLLVAALV